MGGEGVSLKRLGLCEVLWSAGVVVGRGSVAFVGAGFGVSGCE